MEAIKTMAATVTSIYTDLKTKTEERSLYQAPPHTVFKGDSWQQYKHALIKKKLTLIFLFNGDIAVEIYFVFTFTLSVLS